MLDVRASVVEDHRRLGGVEGLPRRVTLDEAHEGAVHCVGERLGRTESSAAIDLSRAVLGPLRMELTAMGGQVSTDPAHPVDGAWLAGARAGFGADTPIGPVRAQYGVNGDRRTQWYLRVGRWF